MRAELLQHFNPLRTDFAAGLAEFERAIHRAISFIEREQPRHIVLWRGPVREPHKWQLEMFQSRNKLLANKVSETFLVHNLSQLNQPFQSERVSKASARKKRIIRLQQLREPVHFSGQYSVFSRQ